MATPGYHRSGAEAAAELRGECAGRALTPDDHAELLGLVAQVEALELQREVRERPVRDVVPRTAR